MGWIMTSIAAMTAFYMFRLYYCIFWNGEWKGHSHESGPDAHTPHEAPLTMTFPLMFLAAITCIAGFIPFGNLISSNGEAYTIHLDMQIAATSIIIAIASITLATWMYAGKRQPVANYLARTFPRLHTAAYHRFYMDEIWLFVTKKIIFRCISTPIAWWDRHVIDQFFNFTAWSTHATADEIRDMQSGNVQQYSIWFLAGALILTLILLI